MNRKFLFKTLFIFFILINTISCKAQLVQTVGDAKKLEVNKKDFVGKPIKDLLNQIKPPIKRVIAIPGEITNGSHIILYLMTDSEYNNQLTQAKKNPLRIDIVAI